MLYVLVVFNNAITMGVLIAYISTIKKLIEPLSRCYQLVVRSQTALVSVSRVFEVIDIQPEKNVLTGASNYNDMADSPIISFKDVTFGYGQENVLVNVSFNVRKGERIAFVGESGSGKTTVIRSVLGLLPGQGKVTKGDIVFEGDSLLNYTQKQWNQCRGTKMSMIFQDCGAMINPNRRIGSQFVEYIRVHEDMPKDKAKDKAIDMLNRMRLPQAKDIMRKYPFQLSGGQRQRVGIAMAMTFQPKLLIADEPTSALDVTTQSQIVKEMMELRDKYDTSIMIVTHNLAVAVYMADKRIVMKDGEVVDRGTRDEILNNTTSDYTKRLLASVPTWREEQHA